MDPNDKGTGPLLHKMCSAPDLKFFGSADNAGTMEGYLSAFGNKDRGGEIVVPGAFKDGMDEFLKNGFIALNHNWDALPIATVADASEDAMGLRFKADFHSTPAAQEARTVAQERISRGKSVSTSIGYRVIKSEPTDSALLLHALELYEGSMVNVPMNQLPTIGSVKGFGSDGLDDELWSLPDGLKFTDQLEAVLAAVTSTLVRAKGIQDMRLKEGRVLSSANVSRMRDMSANLTEHANTLAAMCDQATPAPKALPAIDAARVELARFLREQSRQLGVAL